MRTILIAFTLTAMGVAQAGAAQGLAFPGSQVAPMGWADSNSAYAAAAREAESRFLNRTQSQTEFTPQAFTSEIGDNLESRLNASLERELRHKERKPEVQVGTN